jgi:hypothetical protein
MAGGKRRGKSDANELGKGFAQIPRVLLESEAYKAISTLSAAKALPVFLAKWGAAYALGRKPVCEFTYSEAGQIHGIPRKSFGRGLEELHALGFLDLEEKGGVWQGNQWSATRYRRSERWRKYGTPDFINLPWRQSEPPTRAKPPRRPATKQGKNGFDSLDSHPETPPLHG